MTMKTGLKILSTKQWYGSGHCGICGDKENIVPQAVRYWDPDDGWKVGVLCGPCSADCESRGPRRGDYAYRESSDQKLKIDALSSVSGDDLDGLWADCTE